MTAAWPAALPQFVLLQGYSESLANRKVESETDSGPPKARRRFTNAWRPIQATIRCDDDQVDAFEEFYETTLGGGVQPFTWVSPRTQLPATFRFVKAPPKHQPFGGGVDISFSLIETARTDMFGAVLDFYLSRNSGLTFMMGTH